jgi:hypothetical protein
LAYEEAFNNVRVVLAALLHKFVERTIHDVFLTDQHV